jgi:amidase
MVKYQLDAILSINNNNAGHAAAANYLFLWVTKTGEPWGLTFIARPYQEDTLLKMDLPLNKQQN